MERLRGSARPPRKPAVLALSVGTRRVISAVNASAEAQGILPGLVLADARAQLPNLVVSAADPGGDAASLLRLAHWCGRYSPWTAPQGADCIALDITGCAHLLGGEDGLAAELGERLARQGLTARIGIADTLGAAWAVAHGAASAFTNIPPGGNEPVLSPLSIRTLRIDEKMRRGLERLGVRRIGELYALPRASLMARFAPDLIERLDEALGRSGESLSPLAPPPVRWARRRFPDPIATPEDIAAATQFLLGELCRHLTEEGLGARLLTLTTYRVDGESASVAIGTARPVREPKALWRLFEQRLEKIEPGLGIEDMVLVAKSAEPLAAEQLGLASWSVGVAEEDLAALVDRLANRLGKGTVGRFIPRESHVPERASRLVEVFAPKSKVAWDHDKARPIRLLARPEPIDAVAPVPDDPPLLFRWRRVAHRVRRADGPERIGGEWWRGPIEAKLLRDYYRVEDEDGRRFWLYRAGLYTPDKAPRWFMHGIFA